jgi:hypothetical protein
MIAEEEMTSDVMTISEVVTPSEVEMGVSKAEMTISKAVMTSEVAKTISRDATEDTEVAVTTEDPEGLSDVSCCLWLLPLKSDLFEKTRKIFVSVSQAIF